MEGKIEKNKKRSEKETKKWVKIEGKKGEKV